MDASMKFLRSNYAYIQNIRSEFEKHFFVFFGVVVVVVNVVVGIGIRDKG